MIGQVDPFTTVLADLVKAGTITQAQSDAITAALKAALPVRPSIGGGVGVAGDDENNGPELGVMGEMGMGLDIKADFAVISTTLGITQDQLNADLAAGQSLATIAGAKTAALIAALVATETTNINAQVTAGEITQAEATTLIAGLTTEVTAAVNAAPEMGGMNNYGDHGFGGDHGNNGNNGDHGNGGGEGASTSAPDAEAND